MLRIVTLVIPIALFGLACGTGSEADAPAAALNVPPFKIVVVGAGPDESDGNDSLNPEQADSIWVGASWAFESSERFKRSITGTSTKGVSDLVRLEVRYDSGKGSKPARQIAMELAGDPSVLAVIGHSTSNTTNAAVETYNLAGIPLLVPSASSPTALCAPGDGDQENCEPLSNCFRLIPNDRDAQAPAIALALAKLKLRRVVLVEQTSEDATRYSGPLATALEEHLTGEPFESLDRFELTDIANPEEVEEVRKIISAILDPEKEIDAIVVSGYVEFAQALLRSLSDVLEGRDREHWPRVILSDGCQSPTLKLSGFPEVYVAFPRGKAPCPDWRQGDPMEGDQEGAAELLSDDGRELIRLAKENNQGGFVEYGYDAMLMIGQGWAACRQENNISRPCIVEYLQGSEPFVGACDVYIFEHGENQYSSYFLIRYENRGASGEDAVATDVKSYRPKEVRQFSDRSKHRAP